MHFAAYYISDQLFQYRRRWSGFVKVQHVNDPVSDVFLADGGHYENLGVLPLLRRRVDR